MTPSEARDYVIRHCNPDYPYGKTEWETAINMAIEALEKEIPQRPMKSIGTFNKDLYKLYCPTCGNYIAYSNRMLNKFTKNTDRCGYCGQKIDFER